jgi:hypothetical protein
VPGAIATASSVPSSAAFVAKMCKHAAAMCNATTKRPLFAGVWYESGRWEQPIDLGAFRASVAARSLRDQQQQQHPKACTLAQLRHPGFFSRLRWDLRSVVPEQLAVRTPDVAASASSAPPLTTTRFPRIASTRLTHPWCSLAAADDIAHDPLELLRLFHRAFAANGNGNASSTSSSSSSSSSSSAPDSTNTTAPATATRYVPREVPVISLRGDSMTRTHFSAIVNLFRRMPRPLDRQVHGSMRYLVGTHGDLIQIAMTEGTIINLNIPGLAKWGDNITKAIRAKTGSGESRFPALGGVEQIGTVLLELRFLAAFGETHEFPFVPQASLPRHVALVEGGAKHHPMQSYFPAMRALANADRVVTMRNVMLRHFPGTAYVARDVVFAYDAGHIETKFDARNFNYLAGRAAIFREQFAPFNANASARVVFFAYDWLNNSIREVAAAFVADHRKLLDEFRAASQMLEEASEPWRRATNNTLVPHNDTVLDTALRLVERQMVDDHMHFGCIAKPPYPQPVSQFSTHEKQRSGAPLIHAQVPQGCMNFVDNALTQILITSMLART